MTRSSVANCLKVRLTKPRAGLLEAIQQQLGLKITATRGPIATLLIDRVDRPTQN